MRKVMIFLSAFFAVICILLTVISPDYLSMGIIGLMDVAVALGFVFGLLPCLRYAQGFREGRKSIAAETQFVIDNRSTAFEILKDPFGLLTEIISVRM